MRPLRLFDEDNGEVYEVPPEGADLGRHATAASVRIENKSVSRVHMHIERDDELWWVEPLNPMNPLLLNEHRVDERTPLYGPARLYVGRLDLQLPGVPGQLLPSLRGVCVEALRADDLLILRGHRPELFRLSWAEVGGQVRDRMSARVGRHLATMHRTVLGPTWGEVVARSRAQGAEVPGELVRGLQRLLAERRHTRDVDASRLRVGFNGAIRVEPGPDVHPLPELRDVVKPIAHRGVGHVPLGAFVSSLFAEERELMEDAVEEARMAAGA